MKRKGDRGQNIIDFKSLILELGTFGHILVTAFLILIPSPAGSNFLSVSQEFSCAWRLLL